MFEDALTSADALMLLQIDADEVIDGFRQRYGSYRVGRFEDDPEQLDYEETLDLGRSLGGPSAELL
jgi:hypothetical protein